MSTVLLLALLIPSLERRAVVITTDCGASFDDQWAIVHMAVSSEIELRGIITSHAPRLTPAAGASETKLWLERIPRNLPVFAGSSLPLEDRNTPRPNSGVSFLIDQANGRDDRNRLAVVVIGPATDVASALLLEPKLADKISVIAMAFDGWPEGGDVWNVKHDVRAWQVLLESRTPIVIGDARVTQRDLIMTSKRAQTLFDGTSEVGHKLVGLLDDWISANPKFAESVSGQTGAGVIWDEVATASLLGFVKTETHPRPQLSAALRFQTGAARGTIDWVTSIDGDRVWRDLARKLKDHGSRPTNPEQVD